MPTTPQTTAQLPDNCALVGVDTESFLIHPGRVAPRLVCMTVSDPDGSNAELLVKPEGIQEEADLLMDESVVQVLANAPFDMGVFAQEDPSLIPYIFLAYLSNRIADVQTWQRLYMIKYGWADHCPRLGNAPATYHLKDCVSWWLKEVMTGKGGEDAWRFRYHELADIPLVEWPQEAKDYALGDATSTVRCFQAMVESEGVLPDFWNQCRYDWALHLFSARGLRTEEYAARKLEENINKHIDEFFQDLLNVGIYRIGGTKKDPKAQLNKKVVQARVEAACARQGKPVPKTEPSKLYPEGQVKTDDETLELSDDEELHKLAEIGSYLKLKSTYLEPILLGTIYPLNPRYRVVVNTGRSSCSNPNIQNQPRKGFVRECFVPRKGYVFVDADYNIAELRSLSQVIINMFGYSEMANIINQGKDIHCLMGAAIYQAQSGIPCSYEQFLAFKKTNKKVYKEYRQLAKALDFGAPGGLGAKTMVDYARVGYGVIITESQARDLIDLYKRTFPEMEQYFTSVGALVGFGGRTTVVQHGSGRIRGGVGFCDGCNGYFQGLTADGAKEACFLVAMECYTGVPFEYSLHDLLHDVQPWDGDVNKLEDYGVPISPLYGSFPVWFIHDEIGLESPFDKAQGAAARLSHVMCAAMDKFTPDVPATAEADIRRRWYKEAEPTFDKEGKLIPWSPRHPDSLTEEDDEETRHAVNYLWDLELQARKNNPDPWC